MSDLLKNKVFLHELCHEFLMFEQWFESGMLDLAYQSQQSLKTMIEVVEIEHCGSRGGFDKGQGGKDRCNLAVRFEWVMKKNGLSIDNCGVIKDYEYDKVKRGIKLVKNKNIR